MQTYEQALEQGKEFLLLHDDYLIVSHVQPDGDAVSSTVMVGWLLSCLGKKFTMINEGPIPQRMQYLWNADQILNASLQSPPKQFQQVICVDCADYERVGKVTHWFADEANILNIDHHPTNNGYGKVNIIKDDAAATAEILYDLVEACGVAWDKEAATAAYTGLLTDTGGFRYSSTSPKVMKIASDLLALGVNGPELAERLLEEITLPQLKVLTRALNTLSISEDGQIAWVVVTPEDMTECGAQNDDLEGIVNYPRNIQGVEVGILFKVISDEVAKVSFRSAGKVDVAALAQGFGGGGHVRAAGARVEGPWQDTVNEVVERVKSQL
ncbi:bifunctional oligoribonuclease/PAP phosphatase NrnA [Paenibacillus urinalis]|uniref:Bifunctional oligoribonuclease/PAP phosphatase NrnA n=1 Tax=Paenibacillus urinalis TaxID=521520 RepID=A0ABY7XKN8_9BACL|nr:MULTISPECIES: bifunctional oligoribonuclease/PAP phosphatase NrnA [Paenibacillus]WDH95996.1 bifunctional oligoribonuclease/PAP phosphatase NrnA [Paenibacillus urinalis]WDI04215.1 bifunctional oligoribonuclease/PAP phosphatase NrnA [Paenibacillus urinalis]GAK38462.1 putative phosphoesterase [Paenibacillus sp. TCA20]